MWCVAFYFCEFFFNPLKYAYWTNSQNALLLACLNLPELNIFFPFGLFVHNEIVVVCQSKIKFCIECLTPHCVHTRNLTRQIACFNFCLLFRKFSEVFLLKSNMHSLVRFKIFIASNNIFHSQKFTKIHSFSLL